MKSIHEKLDKISEFVINLRSVKKFEFRRLVMSSAEELIRTITDEVNESSVIVSNINDQIDEMSSARDTLESDALELEQVISTLENIDSKVNEVRASRSSTEQWIQ